MQVTRRDFLRGAGAILASSATGSVLGRMSLGATGVAPKWLPAKVYSYGHSFTMDNYPYIPKQPDGHHGEYARMVAADLGVPVDMNGRSGTKLVDTVRAVIAPNFAGAVGRMWEPATTHGRDVVLLQNVHNDEAFTGDPDYLLGYDGALRLMLGVYGSRRVIYSRNAARHGSWASAGYIDRAPNGEMWFTKQGGASIEFTVSGDSCHIATAACDGDYLAYGTMRIEVNGKTVAYFNGTDKMGKYTDSVDKKTLVRWSPYGIRITGMDTIAGTTGNKTLSIHKSAADGKPIWVNAVYLTSGTPPHVFVALEPPRNPQATSQASVQMFEQNDPTYRALIQRACADYSYVNVVDLAPGWDNSTMVATGVDPLNFHPNLKGMRHIADAFEAAIKATQ